MPACSGWYCSRHHVVFLEDFSFRLVLITVLTCSWSMATPTTSHTFQSLAASAVAAYNRKDSERLFYEALEDARAEASSDNDTGLVRRLASIDDQALLKNTVKHELQGRVGRRVIKFTESLNGAAQIALAISECSMLQLTTERCALTIS